ICPDCMTQASVGHHCPHCVGEATRGARRARIVLGGGLSVARLLLYANVAMFLVGMFAGGRASPFGGASTRTLLELGAMQPLAIALEGQYWRFFTSMFLHAGLFHLAFNMYALYLFGDLVEDIFGRATFIAIYFLSGFLGGVASYAFGSPYVLAVGASGAIFGLIGAWAAYNYKRRGTALGSANLRGAALIVGINLLLGFTIPGVDNLAHIGGLLAGGVAGFGAEGFTHRPVNRFVRLGVFAALAAIGIALTVWRTSVIADPLSGLF
ncbi:MAG TPA: rhomboid family intramembrane serine protease, partial [Actinomycetota bacterium]|nr:rhomboid family intramembrane serine protease [Actinomycetota bacterium]